MATNRRADNAPNLFTSSVNNQPLAARMRPRTLGETVGQDHLLAPGKALRNSIERGKIGSMILWGPPGTGKTTLARVIANATNRVFVPFSAVSEGVPRIRQIVAEAEARLQSGGQPTILFIDEIHRLNKSQQDTLLPHVEEGTFTLIGATTETPSFEINGALLSRSRVFVLEPLSWASLETLLRRALADEERGLASMKLDVTDEAIKSIAELADGDARRALTVLEAAALHVGEGGRIDEPDVREALQLRFQRSDKSGEEHYNMLSAYHKSLRGSDPQAALYWMARMIEGGADPMTLFRRAIAMAAEDIGLADPEALKLAIAARDAFHMLGPPEGFLPLVEMTVYLATAPKSNAVVNALHAALQAARNSPAAPVPLNIRNAPTQLHRDLGYHEGYKYAHDSPEGYIPQQTMPAGMEAEEFYKPGRFGFEKEIAKRLEYWASLKRGESGEGGVAE
jgi:putative ATPase